MDSLGEQAHRKNTAPQQLHLLRSMSAYRSHICNPIERLFPKLQGLSLGSIAVSMSSTITPSCCHPQTTCFLVNWSVLCKRLEVWLYLLCIALVSDLTSMPRFYCRDLCRCVPVSVVVQGHILQYPLFNYMPMCWVCA